jgi:hypothetical protein
MRTKIKKNNFLKCLISKCLIFKSLKCLISKCLNLKKTKKMKRKALFVSAIALMGAAGSVFTSCDDKEKEKETPAVAVTGVTVSPATLSLAVGETYTFTATVAPDNAADTSVTWTSGNTATATVSSEGVVTAVAAGTATITAAANDGSGKQGIATVTVTTAELAARPTTLSDIDADGTTTSVTVTANVAWEATTTAGWITLTNATGSGNGSFTVTVSANTAPDAVERQASITLHTDANVADVTITVAQLAPAPPELSVSPSAISAANTAGAYSIEVTSNTAWTATVTSDNSEWCTLTNASGDGNGTVTVNVTANPQEARTATVAVTAGNLTEEVTVNQEKASPPPPHAASSNTWQYGNQIWSDRINVEGDDCDKAFARSESAVCGTYSDAGVTRYYYNWHYVDANKESMCPSPWRVPTSDDFDAILAATTGPDLTAAWGFGGRYNEWAEMNWNTEANPQGLLLWSATPDPENEAKAKDFNAVPGWDSWAVGSDSKMEGRQVRCVKD